MKVISIILVNVILLTLSNPITIDLPFNNYYTEDINKYANKIIPEGSQFFIRFPKDSENEMKFYIIIPKNVTIFPIYISEFSEYPDNTLIVNTNFVNEIRLSKQEEEHTQYYKYSYDIAKIKPYQVIYFENDEAIDYISFYSYSFAENTFSNLPVNQSLTIFSLKTNSSYYLKFSASDGKSLQIETSAALSYLPNYELDIKCFPNEPSELEVTNVDRSWQKNLTYKLSDDYYNEFRTYEYELNEKHQFCTIHIYNKNALNELHIRIEISEEKKLPTWAIVLIAVLAVLLIIGICFLIKKACCSAPPPPSPVNKNGDTTCLQRTHDMCCAICICAYCFASVAQAGQTDY